MHRNQNAIYVFVVALLLLSPLAYITANALLPDFVGAPTESELENRTYAKPPKLSIKDVAKGKTQSRCESFISDHIPNRDAYLLANAGLQRRSIALSSAIFGFDIYPTYFGSSHNVAPSDKVIVESPQMQPTEKEKKWSRAWIETLNEATTKYPETRFVYDCVVRGDQNEANPAFDLVSGKKVTARWIQEHLLNKLQPSILSFVDPTENYDEIKAEWIPTEEHWTIKRALKSYNKIAECLGLKTFEYENPRRVAPCCYGDYSRMGLDLDFTYDLFDTPYDFSSLRFYEVGDADGTEISIGKRELVLDGQLEISPYSYHGYTRYYGSGSCEALNDGSHSGKTAVVICDSLSYPLRRVIASNYEHSVFLLPGNDHLKSSLESYLEKYHPDDVIVIIHATKYRSFARRSPEFIGLD